MNEPDRGLRSVDAIHLATARILAEDLDAVVSYDDRGTVADGFIYPGLAASSLGAGASGTSK